MIVSHTHISDKHMLEAHNPKGSKNAGHVSRTAAVGGLRSWHMYDKIIHKKIDMHGTPFPHYSRRSATCPEGGQTAAAKLSWWQMFDKCDLIIPSVNEGC